MDYGKFKPKFRNKNLDLKKFLEPGEMIIDEKSGVGTEIIYKRRDNNDLEYFISKDYLLTPEGASIIGTIYGRLDLKLAMLEKNIFDLINALNTSGIRLKYAYEFIESDWIENKIFIPSNIHMVSTNKFLNINVYEDKGSKYINVDISIDIHDNGDILIENTSGNFKGYLVIS